MGFNVIDSEINTDSVKMKEFLIKESEKYFSPEFINRIDEIVVFNKFAKESMVSILNIEIGHCIARMKEKGYSLLVSDDFMDFLLEKGFDPKYGARPIKRAISNYIETPFSKKVYSEEIKKETTYIISLKENEIVFKERN
jgi:ATP-dependent Clp protease ATP-binding subunit ClpC